MYEKTEQAQVALTANGIAFETKNDGLQLVVEGRECPIDYWPTTGKWTVRDRTKLTGYSLRSLIQHIIS